MQETGKQEEQTEAFSFEPKASPLQDDPKNKSARGERMGVQEERDGAKMNRMTTEQQGRKEKWDST